MLADHHVERPSSLVLTKSIMQICSVDSQHIYIPAPDAMPNLTFRLPHGICNTDLQQLPTGSTDPVRAPGALDPARNLACARGTADCVRDTSCGVARAPRHVIVSSQHEYLRRLVWRCARRASITRSGLQLSCVTYGTRCLLHRARKSCPSFMCRRSARSRVSNAVCALASLARGQSCWWDRTATPPRLSHA